MVKVKEDMTGWIMAEHGVPDSRLTVIRQAEDYIQSDGTRISRWLCQCSCGSEPVIARGIDLKRGGCRSCGCMKEDLGIFKKKYNKYDLSGNYGIGWTNNTNDKFYFDLEDYELISQYTWTTRIKNKTSNTKILTAKIKGKTMTFHKFLGYSNYDHINRNEFDNRKENLRPATPSQNAQNKTKSKRNTSGFIGVSFNEQLQKWKVHISINKHVTHLGYFANKEDAIKTRLQAEATYYKEFAPQRHLFEEYGIKMEE
jgi:hypothetical protein